MLFGCHEHVWDTNIPVHLQFLLFIRWSCGLEIRFRSWGGVEIFTSNLFSWKGAFWAETFCKTSLTNPGFRSSNLRAQKTPIAPVTSVQPDGAEPSPWTFYFSKNLVWRPTQWILQLRQCGLSDSVASSEDCPFVADSTQKQLVPHVSSVFWPFPKVTWGVSCRDKWPLTAALIMTKHKELAF